MRQQHQLSQRLTQPFRLSQALLWFLPATTRCRYLMLAEDCSAAEAPRDAPSPCADGHDEWPQAERQDPQRGDESREAGQALKLHVPSSAPSCTNRQHRLSEARLRRTLSYPDRDGRKATEDTSLSNPRGRGQLQRSPLFLACTLRQLLLRFLDAPPEVPGQPRRKPEAAQSAWSSLQAL